MKYNTFDKLYGSLYKNIYFMLNTENSFDVNWFKIKYNLLHKSNDEAFSIYKNSNDIYAPNNIQLCNTSNSMVDGMIENSIERLWFDLLFKYGEKFIIINKEKS